MLPAMLFRLLRMGWLVAIAVGLGCSASSNSSGATGTSSAKSKRRAAGAAPASQQLEVVSDDPLQLAFGEQQPIRVQLTDAEGPVAGVLVSFALVGRPQDSSLSGIDVATDDDGYAENTLIAGQMAAAFKVRISSPAASETFVDVAVGNAGFGTLVVDATYTGHRAVAQRTVFAQANMTCAQAARMPGDPTVTLGRETNEARFLALPAGVTFAVSATAQSASGTLVATSCKDGVTVQQDAETPLALSYSDRALMPAGQFALETELDTSAPAAVLAGALRDATNALVDGDAAGLPVADPEGHFMLDSLVGTLRSADYAKLPGALDAATALSLARATAFPGMSPDHGLQALFDVNGEGPHDALARVLELSQKALAGTRIKATVALSNTKHPLAWQSESMQAQPIAGAGGAMNTSATPVSVDLTVWQGTTDVGAKFVAAKDTIELSSVRLRVQFGLLATGVLGSVLGGDKGGDGDEIRGLLGCASLEEWLGKQSLISKKICDASCVADVCDRALARVQGAGQAALVALDSTRPTLTLKGELMLEDRDGDLIPEQLTGEAFSGQWDPPASGGSGDAVSGPATAMSLAPAVSVPTR